MSAPVRLRLSRAKGFDLQALSIATNGRAAVVVTRPSRWGNPFDFRRSGFCWLALAYGCRGDRLGRQQAAVIAFREWLAPADGLRVLAMDARVVMEGKGGARLPLGETARAGKAPPLDDVRRALGGRNLACWCAADAPCHADVLLELARDF